MDENSSKLLPQEVFLNADLSDFRYERSGRPNEYRLYHCTKEGKSRFALYFFNPKKINDEPWSIEVCITDVDIHPYTVVVQVDETLRHHSVPDPVLGMPEREISQKVCAILDAHPPSTSVIPM
jgi:hypothetical protein